MGSCSSGYRHIQEQTDLGVLKGLKVWIWPGPFVTRDFQIPSKWILEVLPPEVSVCKGKCQPVRPSFGESKFATTQQPRQCSNVHTEQRTIPQRYAHNPCRTGWYWSTGRVARSVHSVAPLPAAMLITLRRLCGSSSIPFIQISRTFFMFTIPAKQH
jgi:hypothetical protein